MIVIHATAHKAGSTWFRLIFQEKLIWTQIGMKTAHWQVHLGGGINRHYSHGEIVDIPDQTIAYCMYSDYGVYQKTVKGKDVRSFYVLRDPRELVVSTYYSWKNSHPVGKEDKFLGSRRNHLNKINKAKGMIFVMNDLKNTHGIFEAQRTWIQAKDKDMMLVKFEEFFGENQAALFSDILRHCSLTVPKNIQQDILDKFSFYNLSGGRRRGETNNSNHWRRGIADSWKEEMPDMSLEHFYSLTGSLVEDLGYER